ncbi:MAG: hypothetical protein ACR2O2_09680 [Ruegeria sp.]
MSEHPIKMPYGLVPAVVVNSGPVNQRVAELRMREPADINHGEALMLQGLAASSLREQRLPEAKIKLD